MTMDTPTLTIMDVDTGASLELVIAKHTDQEALRALGSEFESNVAVDMQRAIQAGRRDPNAVAHGVLEVFEKALGSLSVEQAGSVAPSLGKLIGDAYMSNIEAGGVGDQYGAELLQRMQCSYAALMSRLMSEQTAQQRMFASALTHGHDSSLGALGRQQERLLQHAEASTSHLEHRVASMSDQLSAGASETGRLRAELAAASRDAGETSALRGQVTRLKEALGHAEGAASTHLNTIRSLERTMEELRGDAENSRRKGGGSGTARD